MKRIQNQFNWAWVFPNEYSSLGKYFPVKITIIVPSSTYYMPIMC